MGERKYVQVTLDDRQDGRSPGKKPPDHPQAEHGLSHMWLELQYAWRTHRGKMMSDLKR